jgi:hypothetical protein
MKEKIPGFVDKWGQTIVFAILVLMMLSKMGNATINERMAESIARTDHTLADIWSAVRLGTPGNLPVNPPVK